MKTTRFRISSLAVALVVVMGVVSALVHRDSALDAPRSAMEPEPAVAPVATSRPAPDTRKTSPDVPADSVDPLLDGMKFLVREMFHKGFPPDGADALAARIKRVLEVAGVGDDAGRTRESLATASTFLAVQRDYHPKAGADPKRALTPVDESRIRILAEGLGRDLNRRLTNGPETKLFKPAPPPRPNPGYEVVEWKTLSGFEYTEGMRFPEEVRKLHGKKVVIAGYMYTLDEIENIKRFLVVETLWPGSAGVSPNAHQVIEIIIDGLQGVEFSSQPVMLLGTLDVGEQMEDGMVTSVYRLRLDGPQGVKPFD